VALYYGPAGTSVAAIPIMSTPDQIPLDQSARADNPESDALRDDDAIVVG